MPKDLCKLQQDMLKDKVVMGVLANLARLGYLCAVAQTDDGVWVIDYARPDDLDKPAIHIEGGRIKLPAGSSLDLLNLIIGG